MRRPTIQVLVGGTPTYAPAPVVSPTARKLDALTRAVRADRPTGGLLMGGAFYLRLAHVERDQATKVMARETEPWRRDHYRAIADELSAAITGWELWRWG